jgi:PAP_fibrillin
MNNAKALIDRLSTTDRGLNMTLAQQQEIDAAIVQLEAQNPTPEPLESPDLMGDWRLIYTTSRGILGLDQIPLTELGEVYQCLRGDRLYNVAETKGALGIRGVVAVAATYEPSTDEAVSSRRVQVQFKRSILGLQAAMGYGSIAEFVARLEQGSRFLAVDFPIPVREKRGLGWLDVTYLDAKLRVGRGNEGSVFVLIKD